MAGVLILILIVVPQTISQILIPYGDQYWEITNTFVNANSWALCNDTYMLTGFYKGNTNRLTSLNQLYCIRPSGSLFITDCVDVSVIGVPPGYAECPSGTMIHGIYRGNGDNFWNIEQLRCCNYTLIDSNTNVATETVVQETTYDEFGRCLDQNQFQKTCIMPAPYYMTGIYLSSINSCGGGVHCIEYARMVRMYIMPTESPTLSPTNSPSVFPSRTPTSQTVAPTRVTMDPTKTPILLTSNPSVLPSKTPSMTPLESPSASPSKLPTNTPSAAPTLNESAIDSGTNGKQSIIWIIIGLFICVILALLCIFIGIYFKQRNKNNKNITNTSIKETEIVTSTSNTTDFIGEMGNMDSHPHNINLTPGNIIEPNGEAIQTSGNIENTDIDDDIYIANIVHNEQNNNNNIQKMNHKDKDKIFKEMLASQNNDMEFINNEVINDMNYDANIANNGLFNSVTKGDTQGMELNDNEPINDDNNFNPTPGDLKFEYQLQSMKKISQYV